jgi:hypothetical protein
MTINDCAIYATAIRLREKRKVFFTVKCETVPKMRVKYNLCNNLTVSLFDRDSGETGRDTGVGM